MVGPVRSNAAVRSQTQLSPSAEVISDSNRRRTGSPKALNALARSTACSADSGGDQRCAAPVGDHRQLNPLFSHLSILTSIYSGGKLRHVD